MSTARLRTVLGSALRPLGFAAQGSGFVFRQAELEHEVTVLADRRLKGRVDVIHSIYDATAAPISASARSALLEERLQGFRKPYPTSWSVESFDPALAAKQSAAIVSTFASLGDVAHYCSDRPHAPDFASHASPRVNDALPFHRSLSNAGLDALLHRLSLAIFSEGFQPAPRLGPGIWARDLDVGGFRHCAVLAANNTATLAWIDYFSLASNDVAKGSQHLDVARRLVRAPRQALFDEAGPLLLPLTGEALHGAHVASALMRQLDATSPNALPRDEA